MDLEKETPPRPDRPDLEAMKAKYVGAGSASPTEADLFACIAEVERVRNEIAEAREECPSIRMQDHFDASLLELVNLEVSRGFNRDAEIVKLQAQVERLRAVGPDFRPLLIEACGMMKLLDRYAKHKAVAEFLAKVEAALRAVGVPAGEKK